MSKLSNCFRLIEILSTGRKYSIKELSDILEVKPRMIRIYKDELEKAGIYIESLRGKYGGYYLKEDYSFPIRNITLKDIEILKNTQDNQILDIANKLENINKTSDLRNIKEKEIFKVLNECILNKEKLEIIYKSTKGSVRKRIIHPLALYYNMGVWYVATYCEYKKTPRRFRVLSIQEYKKTNKHF